MFEWLNDNPYTCPLLMVAQGWLRWQKWHYGCDGWVLLQTEKARAHCHWPIWCIKLECWAWNTPPGTLIRRLCGTKQREWRLRQLEGSDNWLNSQWNYPE